MMRNTQILFGKTLSELTEITGTLGMPSFTARQLAEWLYQKHAGSFDEMSNISKKNRTMLADAYALGVSLPTKMQQSADGTRKYLFATDGGRFVETAMIPDKDRKTVCLSSQVGCKMGCLFCMTARQGFQGHLTAGEIVNQYRSIDEREALTNIVYMGMGEPLDNLGEVLKSIEIFTADWGFALAPKRITVSTIGIIPAMKTFLRDSRSSLAVSLHSPFEEERRRMMPVEQIYPVKEVVETIRTYDLGLQRKLTFEYIMFEGINDSPRHVKELARLLNGLRCRVNLIRFHALEDSPLRGSSAEVMQAFKDGLNQKGILAIIRASRGEDIFAACGLLSTKAYVKSGETDY